MPRLKDTTIREFGRLAGSADEDLARPALLIPLIESTHLDADRYVARLDAMGLEASTRLAERNLHPQIASSEALVTALNIYVFE